MPTVSTWYRPTLSSKLRRKSSAVLREGAEPGAASPDVESGPVNGSSVPFLRFRPVRFGTVTLRRMLLDGELVDCRGLAMASSGRRTRLAGVSALGGFNI